MTIDTAPPATLAAEPASRGPRRFAGPRLAIVAAVAGLAILSLARIIADADRLTSSTTIGTGLRLAVPIALVGVGGLYSERSGTVNIGLEGMMTLGTVMAGYAGWQWGPWAALVAGAVGGIVGAMIMSLATTTFGVNHIIAGFAINIIGPGVARYLANIWFTTPEAQAAGGSISSSPRSTGTLPRVSLPVLSDGADLLGDLERKGWFLISDAAGMLRGVTTGVRADTLIAVALVIATAYVVWRTPFGLRLRSAGEKPGAAESLGVSVPSMRHVGLAISGAFAGLGGAVLVFAGSNQYQAGQTGGRGFLGLAALVFGNWMPAGVAAGAAVFGYADSVRIGLDPGHTVLGLILAAAFALTLIGVIALARRRWVEAAIELGLAALLYVTYLTVDDVNNQFVYMTPYIVTLVVVTAFAQRQRPPAAEGVPYFRGQSL